MPDSELCSSTTDRMKIEIESFITSPGRSTQHASRGRMGRTRQCKQGRGRTSVVKNKNYDIALPPCEDTARRRQLYPKRKALTR